MGCRAQQQPEHAEPLAKRECRWCCLTLPHNLWSAQTQQLEYSVGHGATSAVELHKDTATPLAASQYIAVVVVACR
jgi:hypothetical protein